MPDVHVSLPTLHDGQVSAFDYPARFKAIRCGRRWGKTTFGEVIAADGAINQECIGWFAPDYKKSSEAFNDLAAMLLPIRTSSSKVEGVIRTIGGGRIDFWTLDNESAGRSRHYHKVIIDEGAFTKNNMLGIWEKSIRPTLLDYQGSAIVLSNTNGNDPDNFLYKICNEKKLGFVEFHAPTFDNPLIPIRDPHETEAEWLARREVIFKELEAENHPLVYQQEYLAEFVDWSGIAFFGKDKLLINGKPAVCPKRIDSVFAVIDTAIKTGKENDGTGVIYFGFTKSKGNTLYILDWDLVQIEGASLEAWLPNVFRLLESFAKEYEARAGSLGAFIEDTNSGTILLQQAVKRGWKAQAIDTELVSKGKDERAINVSGYVYQGLVKVTEQAYDKVTTFKGSTRNQMMSQILGFRVADPDANKRADDLLDCFCYGISLALGDSSGY
jgi:hypothetical protein